MLDNSTKGQRRKAIFALEKAMLNEEQVDLPVKHYFADGLYARELFIPKGVLLTGKIHKFSSLNILLSGEISLATEDGNKRINAPYVVSSKPGIKRVGLAHTDCLWLTIFKNEDNEENTDILEKRLTTNDYSELPEAAIKSLLEGGS